MDEKDFLLKQIAEHKTKLNLWILYSVYCCSRNRSNTV